MGVFEIAGFRSGNPYNQTARLIQATKKTHACHAAFHLDLQFRSA